MKKNSAKERVNSVKNIPFIHPGEFFERAFIMALSFLSA